VIYPLKNFFILLIFSFFFLGDNATSTFDKAQISIMNRHHFQNFLAKKINKINYSTVRDYRAFSAHIRRLKLSVCVFRAEMYISGATFRHRPEKAIF